MFTELDVLHAETYIEELEILLDVRNEFQSDQSQMGLRQHEEKLIALQKEVFLLKLQLFHHKNANLQNLNEDKRLIIDLKVKNDVLNEELKHKKDTICRAALILHQICGSSDSDSGSCSTRTNSRSSLTKREQIDAIDYQCLFEQIKTHASYLIQLSEEREREYRLQYQCAQEQIQLLEQQINELNHGAAVVKQYPTMGDETGRLKKLYVVPNWDVYICCTFFLPFVLQTGDYFRKYRIIGEPLGNKRRAPHKRYCTTRTSSIRSIEMSRTTHVRIKSNSGRIPNLMHLYDPTARTTVKHRTN